MPYEDMGNSPFKDAKEYLHHILSSILLSMLNQTSILTSSGADLDWAWRCDRPVHPGNSGSAKSTLKTRCS